MMKLLNYNNNTNLLFKNVRKLLSVQCWKCGKTQDSKELFCKVETCQIIQSIECNNHNCFDLFDINYKSYIDDKQLDNKFKNLQKLLHPDKFVTKSNEEKDLSATNSSTINKCYQILKNPLKRSKYILKQYYDIDESDIINDSLMIDMFELRQEADEIHDKDDVLKMIDKVSNDLARINISFQEALQDSQSTTKQQLCDFVIQMIFLTKVHETLQDKLDL